MLILGCALSVPTQCEKDLAAIMDVVGEASSGNMLSLFAKAMDAKTNIMSFLTNNCLQSMYATSGTHLNKMFKLASTMKASQAECEAHNVTIEKQAKSVVNKVVVQGVTDPSAFSADIHDACTALNFVRDNCVDTQSDGCTTDSSGAKANLDQAIKTLNTNLHARNQPAILAAFRLIAIDAFTYFNTCKKWTATFETRAPFTAPSSCKNALDQVIDLIPTLINRFFGAGCDETQLLADATAFLNIYRYQIDSANGCYAASDSCSSKATSFQSEIDAFVVILNQAVHTGQLPPAAIPEVTKLVNAGWDLYTTCYSDSQ